jgi:peptidoglycan/LPS O-acetylase OafA/YrhL
MLACVLAAGAMLLPPHGFEELGRTALSTIFFVSNFDFFSMSGYFDGDARERPLLHTWSLAVEEQFYVVFPLFLFALYRFVRERLRLMLWAAALISLALGVWMLQRNAAAAFFLAPFRGYELLIGAALAGLSFPARAPPYLRDAVSLLGLAAIGLSLFWFSDEMPFPGAAALLPCIGTAMVIYAGAGKASLGGRLISGPLFAYFGALSYSLYLWHWPVLVLGKDLLLAEPTPLQVALMLAIAVAAATISWRWIEQPFLRRRARRAHILLGGAALMAAGAVVAGSIMMTDGAPSRFEARALHMFAQRAQSSPQRWRCHNFLVSVRPYTENCTLGAEAPPRMAVWSDSHGVELAAALSERLAPRGESVMQITSSACPPALGYSWSWARLCAEQNQATLAGLIGDANIDTVIFAADLSGYPREDWPTLSHGYARAVEAIAAAGKAVVLVYPIPVFDQNAPDALGLIVARGGNPNDFGRSRAAFEAANREAVRLLDRLRADVGASAVVPALIFCDDRLCHAYLPQHGVLYFNRDHPSMTGARLIAAGIPLEQRALRGRGTPDAP